MSSTFGFPNFPSSSAARKASRYLSPDTRTYAFNLTLSVSNSIAKRKAIILGQSPAMVSSVDHLSIDRVNLLLEPDCQDEDIDSIDWLELLRPFTAVKTLHGSKQLAGHIALALDGGRGDPVTEELPILDTLSLEDQSVRSVEQFITVRRLSGHPITFVDPGPLPAADVLVDGYVARTFASEDATNYSMRLLKTPSS
ncbi:hypothetical protein V8E53_009893 [Lactarius tabidus]